MPLPIPDGYHLESGPPITFTGAGGDQIIIGPNPKRWSLMIGTNTNSAGGSVIVSCGEIKATATNGFGFGPSTMPFAFTYDNMGPQLWNRWTVTFGLNGNSLTLVEVYLAKGK
jgi:hypothetical protein